LQGLAQFVLCLAVMAKLKIHYPPLPAGMPTAFVFPPSQQGGRIKKAPSGGASPSSSWLKTLPKGCSSNSCATPWTYR
jgi:hypothetical protein